MSKNEPREHRDVPAGLVMRPVPARIAFPAARFAAPEDVVDAEVIEDEDQIAGGSDDDGEPAVLPAAAQAAQIQQSLIEHVAALSLDGDPQTSLAVSLHLHLLSEHGLPTALHMDDEEAERWHRHEHRNGVQDHRLCDLRFRAGRALETLFDQDFTPATDDLKALTAQTSL